MFHHGLISEYMGNICCFHMQQNSQLKINLKWSELDFSKGDLVNLNIW